MSRAPVDPERSRAYLEGGESSKYQFMRGDETDTLHILARSAFEEADGTMPVA